MSQKEVENSSPSIPGSGEERIIGVVPDVYKWTRLGLKQWFDLVVTGKRLVFVRITDLNSSPDKYVNRNIDEILAENKKNFAVSLSEFKSFSFAPGVANSGTCGRVHELNGEMKFSTAKEKYFFYVPLSHTRVAKEFLKEAGLNYDTKINGPMLD